MGQESSRIWSLTVFLSIIWALSILYGEMFAFWVPSMWSCSWPHQPHRSSSSIKAPNDSGNHVKVAVLTDPQLMDRTSLHLTPKSLALEIAQFYTDLFMRRAFLSSVLPFRPDVILFLGDYFDGGPFLSDEEWQESLSRFKHIFHLNMLQQTTDVKVYFLSGNHDIGYAALHSQFPEVIKRYEKEFGVRNYRVTIGKVDFIVVDAQTLDGNSQGSTTSDTWNFVLNISKDSSSNPKVLLTHIPLHRPDWTTCGPERSSPVINQRISRAAHDQQISYQNYITEESSNKLLNMIRPALILSGHDHDQCTVTHTSKYGSATEHTVGTVSWQQGNLYPSFMLLSASNLTPPNGSTLEDAISSNLCFLPVQIYIYIWYIILFILTLLMVILWPTKESSFCHFGKFLENIKTLMNSSIFGEVTKQKNEDEDCEYEMIWDAEGSMHLIKQTSKAPPSRSSDGLPVERGNAVLRSTARRQNEQDIEASMPSDVTVQVGLDPTGNLRLRTKKSRTILVIRKLLRAVRAITFIAAFNIPLYMMLLFKDWID